MIPVLVFSKRNWYLLNDNDTFLEKYVQSSNLTAWNYTYFQTFSKNHPSSQTKVHIFLEKEPYQASLSNIKWYDMIRWNDTDPALI